MADDPRRESGRDPKTTGGSEKDEFQDENERSERELGGQPRTGGTDRESGGKSGQTDRSGTGTNRESEEQGGRSGTGNTGTERKSGSGGSKRQASPGRSGQSRTGMDHEESDIGRSGDAGGGRSRPGQRSSNNE